jgi:hypothetical protein
MPALAHIFLSSVEEPRRQNLTAGAQVAFGELLGVSVFSIVIDAKNPSFQRYRRNAVTPSLASANALAPLRWKRGRSNRLAER